MNLVSQTCVPCSGTLPPMEPADIARVHPQIPEWALIDAAGIAQLQRQYKFANFQQALAFTNRVGAIAEEAGHHPTLLTEWGKVTVTWWTHAINGLHHNDFVMAAKTDALYDA
ncbi:MAG: 4a-hydroxytetrahydrobiopterin dehydratase [Cyanobacteria bacterium J06597_16]